MGGEKPEESQGGGTRNTDQDPRSKADQKESGFSGSPPKNSPSKDPASQPIPGEQSSGSGERSSTPDRSAQATTEEPGAGPSEGGLDIPAPSKESQIGGEDEKFDSRFSGSDSTLEENRSKSSSKTALEDVLLSKPQGSLLKGRQPIPLEYKDILQPKGNGG
jgi:hypothetical protein